MSQGRHSEAAFETVIEAHLLQNGYTQIAREGFDRERPGMVTPPLIPGTGLASCLRPIARRPASRIRIG